jgi:hypothetical protein
MPATAAAAAAAAANLTALVILDVLALCQKAVKHAKRDDFLQPVVQFPLVARRWPS